MVSKTREAPRNDDFQVRNLHLERFLFGDFTSERLEMLGAPGVFLQVTNDSIMIMMKFVADNDFHDHDDDDDDDEMCGRQ